VLAVLTWALPAGLAKEDPDGSQKDLEQRVAALEKLLKHFSRKGTEVTIKGANLHIVNGLGSTDCTDEQGEEIPDCPNGLGNLIVGYNGIWQRFAGKWATCDTGQKPCVIKARPPLILKSF
jgi:hypothetical protein